MAQDEKQNVSCVWIRWGYARAKGNKCTGIRTGYTYADFCESCQNWEKYDGRKEDQ